MKKIKETVAISNDEIRTMEKYKEYFPCCATAIELRENQKEYVVSVENRFNKDGRTTLIYIQEETSNIKTCMDVFKELGSYKLIETEAEFEDYLNSTVSCDDWRMCKLTKTMLSLNLGQGFINGLADLIGTDLRKYHEMIDLSKECDSRDILMYLLVKKYGGKC